MAATTLNIAPQNDIQFLKDIKAPSATPEYSEHNIKTCTEKLYSITKCNKDRVSAFDK